MRVISGTARRLPLKTVEGMDTRPTTDRIKETLFNMLQEHLCETHFLDLFSGSGAIGIEALSRGARKAVFVENSRQALECIKSNLNTTRLDNKAEIYFADVMTALKTMDGKKEKFDVVFMDPPYQQGFERDVLNYLEASEMIDENTIIIIEADKHTDFSYLEHRRFELFKRKEYKTNMHVFVRRISERDEKL